MARTPKAYSTTATAPMLNRVWTSMRLLRRFTINDVIVTAEAGRSQVEKFVRALRDTGYLRLDQPRVSGRAGSMDVWSLTRNSGPLPPIRRKDGSGVYDPNTLMTWGPGGEPVEGALPPAAARHDQAVRESLRQLRDIGMCKPSAETLKLLIVQGFARLELTEVGRAVADAYVPARSQRAGAGVAAAAAEALA